MTREAIEKSYAQWVHGAPGALRVIRKAVQVSDFLYTEKGAEMYRDYLRAHPEQVYSTAPASIAKSEPTPSDVHVNQPLTQISIAFMQDMRNLIADRVFPNLPVPRQSDKFYKYPPGVWFQSHAKERAPASESAGTGYTVDSTSTYNCIPIAVHHDVPDQVRANADAMIDPDRDATGLVTTQLALRREKDWAAKFFIPGLWSGGVGGVDITPPTLWDTSGSTPIDDIDEQSSSMQSKTGFRPNTLVLGDKVWLTLKNHPEFKGIMAVDTERIVTPALVARILELDQVLIARAVENTAAEGATDAMSYMFNSKDALLCYSNPRPGLMSPSAGYIFSWTGYVGAGPAGQRMSRLRIEPRRADRVEGEMAYDQKVIAPELGVFFDGAVS